MRCGVNTPLRVRDPQCSCLTETCNGAAYSDRASFPLNDLVAFDPALMMWKNLGDEISGTLPPPTENMGIASWEGQLYVFGGLGREGGERDVARQEV